MNLTTAPRCHDQAQILRLLKDLQAKFGMAILFITHDLGHPQDGGSGAIQRYWARSAGQARSPTFLPSPVILTPQQLLAAEPGEPPPTVDDAPEVLASEQLKVWFPLKHGVLQRVVDHVKAVDGVSLSVREGQTLGGGGERLWQDHPGAGAAATAVSEGAIRFQGQRLDGLRNKALRPLRRAMRIVFQDPSVRSVRAFPWARSWRRDCRCRVGRGIRRPPRPASLRRWRSRFGSATQDRYPHEFSGGQRQRIAIAAPWPCNRVC
ncbi:MAG: hypothetical protein U1F42_01125 [Candidatus Competibacteraceae bacterium]